MDKLSWGGVFLPTLTKHVTNTEYGQEVINEDGQIFVEVFVTFGGRSESSHGTGTYLYYMPIDEVEDEIEIEINEEGYGDFNPDIKIIHSLDEVYAF